MLPRKKIKKNKQIIDKIQPKLDEYIRLPSSKVFKENLQIIEDRIEIERLNDNVEIDSLIDDQEINNIMKTKKK